MRTTSRKSARVDLDIEEIQVLQHAKEILKAIDNVCQENNYDVGTSRIVEELIDSIYDLSENICFFARDEASE